MYGFLKIPSSASLIEKKEYRKYMCTLCDALHRDYGIRGRLFTNYDSTLLALLIGCLKDSLSTRIAELPNHLCLRALKYEKPPDVFSFPAAISIMTTYVKFLDKTIENKKKIPKWIIETSNSADKYLSKYGLSKLFFENKLQEQHRLEKKCNDIEVLSNPTSETMFRIFYSIGELLNKPKYSIIFGRLGFELGKLLYIYDGIVDYQNDLWKGNFNCVNNCYLGYNSNFFQISVEIYNYVRNIKKNISLLLSQIDLDSNLPLIKRILLQGFEVKQKKYREKSLNRSKSIILYVKDLCGEDRLTEQVIYNVLTGAFIVDFSAPRMTFGQGCFITIGVLCMLYCCFCREK